MAVHVAIAGAAGRMGKALVRCMQLEQLEQLSLCGAFDRADHPQLGEDAGSIAGIGELGIKLTDSIDAACSHADVIIDFTAPNVTLQNVQWAAKHHTAIVIGTTGLSLTEKEQIRTYASSCPIVLSPNMSLGVNLLMKLVYQAASALRNRGYDAEIIERHHRRKKDAPSGTALALGHDLARGFDMDLEQVAVDGRSGIATTERPTDQIGFHAIRGGDIVGDHTVLFATDGECVELSHRATTRDTFAMGALQAAGWVAGKEPNLYSMQDVLDI